MSGCLNGSLTALYRTLKPNPPFSGQPACDAPLFPAQSITQKFSRELLFWLGIPMVPPYGLH